MRTTSNDRLPLALAATIPVLVVRVGLGFLRFQGKRRRGAHAFESALLAGGLPRARAAQLTQQYHDAGSLRKILRGTALARPWTQHRRPEEAR